MMKKSILLLVILCGTIQLTIAQFSVFYDSVQVQHRDTIGILPTKIRLRCSKENWEISKFRFRYTKGRRVVIDTIMSGDSLCLKDTLDYRNGRIMLEVAEVKNEVSAKTYCKLKHFHINYFREELFITQTTECGFQINGVEKLGYSTQPVSLDALEGVRLCKRGHYQRYMAYALIGKRPWINKIVNNEWKKLDTFKALIREKLNDGYVNIRLMLYDMNEECFAEIRLR